MTESSLMAQRFRGFLPVVVDVETGGFNEVTDALLQIAAVLIDIDDKGRLYCAETISCHVTPFEGANLDPRSMEVNGIDVDHPFRLALDEKQALPKIFKPVRNAIKSQGCNKAILVGHNAHFDLKFINAAAVRAGIKRNPFHSFSTFDTVTLAGLAYGQTVLARAARSAGLEWDTNEAHSAIYDAEITATLFCKIVNDFGFLQA
ncbi:MAG: ribonuclease T [Gammaproteobacteria bacterium]|nr:MAG: ribonuclease T [Gammaproteobacteria bacterium]